MAEVAESERPFWRFAWVVTAGTFYQEGERVFSDVHDPEKAVVIRLRDERYARLVIGVEDPPATVRAIQEELGEE